LFSLVSTRSARTKTPSKYFEERFNDTVEKGVSLLLILPFWQRFGNDFGGAGAIENPIF
jgi:hypothetical protein